MKKLILTTICAAVTASGFAQGTVQFATVGTSPIYVASALATSYAASLRATSGTIGSMPGAAPSTSTGVIDVGLLWGTSSSSVSTLAGVEQIGTTAGQLAGSTVFQVTGTSPNDNDWFTVVAWDSSFGNGLAGEAADLAAGGFWGSSGSSAYGVVGPALQFSLGPTAGPGTVLFGGTSTVGVFHLFALTSSVPEPATLALGGLGAAALLLFRRRK